VPIPKPSDKSQSAGKAPSLVRDALAERLPSLIEFLTEPQYEDGSPRELPTLTLFAESGCLKAALNDRDGGRVAFVTAVSLEALFEALEEGLVFGNLDWRQSRSGRGRKN
jgi:hypothetical protein